MRILIIGDYPLFFGGVTNYTRPLALELSRDHEVYYLYNSTRTEKNSFFKKRKIVERNLENCDFKSYELINGKSVYLNYNNPSNDISSWMDKLFLKFLNKTNPDVVHINEIFGFSSSLIKVCNKKNIKVVTTVHEYWWLCPHRVMVDFNRRICNGPSDIKKCGYCVSNTNSKKSYFIIKALSKLKNDLPFVFKSIIYLRNQLLKQQMASVSFEPLNFGNDNYEKFSNILLEKQLCERLSKNIAALNSCNCIIAVSTDVKRILTSYGVNGEKILVQHIGSTIAEKSVPHIKKLNPEEIVFGFIGGVGYYKGVHQLVEAFSKLPEELKSKAKLKIFGKYSQGYYNSIKRDLIKDQDQDRIIFYGRFTPDDIPQITNEIDISVLPSLCADTAPQTIFESFSCGLPIIAPNVGGFPDFITHEVNGLLYKTSDVDSLSDALQEIISKPKLIDHFKTKIASSKTIACNVNELLILYKGEC